MRQSPPGLFLLPALSPALLFIAALSCLDFKIHVPAFSRPLVLISNTHRRGCGKDGNVRVAHTLLHRDGPACDLADAFRCPNTHQTRRHRSPQGVISLRLTRSERARGLRDRQLTVHTVWVIFSPVEGAGSILEVTRLVPVGCGT